MPKKNARTIYVQESEWGRWRYLAWKQRASLSEYIRRAVEAYSGNGEIKGHESTPPRSGAAAVRRMGNSDKDSERRRGRAAPSRGIGAPGELGVGGRVADDESAVDTTPGGWERREVSADAGYGPQSRPRPYPKTSQTGRKGRGK